MADLDARIKMMSETVAARKAAAAPKSTQDESLIVDSALYDWIELLDEGSGKAATIEHETRRIQKNLEKIHRLTDKERSSDVLKLLTLREFGSTVSFTFEYMCKALPLTEKIRATIYMSLSLVESPGCVYPDDALCTIHADLDGGNPYALRWLASTHARFPKAMVDRFVMVLKSVLLRAGEDSRTAEKALVALLNLWRSVPEQLQLEDSRSLLEALLARPNPRQQYSLNLLMLVCHLASQTAQHGGQVPDSTLLPIGIAVEALLVKVVDQWPVWKHHKARLDILLITSQCLKFFESYPFTLTVGADAPAWWASLQGYLRWALNLTVSFESEEDLSASPDTPLGAFRSAGVVAAMQISASSALLRILKRQVIHFPGKENRYSGGCVESGIAFSSLISPCVKSLFRLIDHKDRHIRFSALKCIEGLPGILNCIQERFVGEAELPAEIDSLHEAVEDATSEIVTLFLSLLHRERIGDTDSMRVVVDLLVQHSSQSASQKAQGLLLTKMNEYAIAATASGLGDCEDSQLHKRREFCRGVMLFAHRNYIQSLQLIATADMSSYRSVFEECGGAKSLCDVFGVGLVPGWVGAEPAGRAHEACKRMTDMWWPPVTALLSAPTFPSLSRYADSDRVATAPASVRVGGRCWGAVTPSASHAADRNVPASSGIAVDLSPYTPPSTTEDTQRPTSRRNNFLSNLIRGSASKNTSNFLSSADCSLEGHKPPVTSIAVTATHQNVPKEKSVKSLFQGAAIRFVVEERIRVRCLGSGVVESASIAGRVILTACKVSEATTCEVGLNLDNSDKFHLIGQRLSLEETIPVDAVGINNSVVNRVDSRGSVFILLQPTLPTENVSAVEYSLPAPLVPLMVASTVSYTAHPDDPVLGSLTFDLTLSNISTDFEIKDLTAVVYVPAYDRLDSFDYAISKGAKAKVIFNAPTRAISVKIPKIKSSSSHQVELVIKATRINMDSFGDSALRETGVNVELKDPAKLSFELVPTKKLQATTNCSVLSGASLRYIKTTAPNGSKLAVSSKVKYQYIVEAYIACVDVVGDMGEAQRVDNPRRFLAPSDRGAASRDKSMSSLGSGARDDDDSVDMDADIDDDSSEGLSIRSLSPAVLVQPSNRRNSLSREDASDTGGAMAVFTKARNVRVVSSPPKAPTLMTSHSMQLHRVADNIEPSGKGKLLTSEGDLDLTDMLNSSMESASGAFMIPASGHAESNAIGHESTSLAVDLGLDISVETEGEGDGDLVFTSCPPASAEPVLSERKEKKPKPSKDRDKDKDRKTKKKKPGSTPTHSIYLGDFGDDDMVSPSIDKSTPSLPVARVALDMTNHSDWLDREQEKGQDS